MTIVGDGSQSMLCQRVDWVSGAMTLQGHMVRFNVGTGKTYSVQTIGDSISDNQTYIPKRPGEMVLD